METKNTPSAATAPAAPSTEAMRTARARLPDTSRKTAISRPLDVAAGELCTRCACACYTPFVHDDLEQRKSQHLDLVQRDEVETSDALFSCVRLVHRALPELALDGIDLDTELCGRALKAPLMITGMTGGTERAGQINRDLAALAQEMGVAFGVGSMRILLDQPELLPTFSPRPTRPPLLCANLGAQQLVQRGPQAAVKLMEML